MRRSPPRPVYPRSLQDFVRCIVALSRRGADRTRKPVTRPCGNSGGDQGMRRRRVGSDVIAEEPTSVGPSSTVTQSAFPFRAGLSFNGSLSCPLVRCAAGRRNPPPNVICPAPLPRWPWARPWVSQSGQPIRAKSLIAPRLRLAASTARSASFVALAATLMWRGGFAQLCPFRDALNGLRVIAA